MIPNSLLRKWVSDESDTITYLERKFLEGEESRRRYQLYCDQEATVESCLTILRGKCTRTQLVERHLLEKEVTERRLNERHFLGVHREELKQFEGKIQEAHRRLTVAQERRSRLKAATGESIAHEKARWEDERRWMLRQLQAITHPMLSTMTTSDDNNANATPQQPQHQATKELRDTTNADRHNVGDVSALTSDGLSARTNAALARARQVLASAT
jgi:hypothetical protein